MTQQRTFQNYPKATELTGISMSEDLEFLFDLAKQIEIEKSYPWHEARMCALSHMNSGDPAGALEQILLAQSIIVLHATANEMSIEWPKSEALTGVIHMALGNEEAAASCFEASDTQERRYQEILDRVGMWLRDFKNPLPLVQSLIWVINRLHADGLELSESMVCATYNLGLCFLWRFNDSQLSHHMFCHSLKLARSTTLADISFFEEIKDQVVRSSTTETFSYKANGPRDEDTLRHRIDVASKVLSNNPSVTLVLANNYECLSSVMLQKGRIKDALEYLDKAMEYRRSSQGELASSLAANLCQKADVYNTIDDLESEQKTLASALRLLSVDRTLDRTALEYISRRLSRLMSAVGNTDASQFLTELSENCSRYPVLDQLPAFLRLPT